ncbi:hypothetical protein [Streptomyces chartreusis]|uniref:hypothetical protein n=1 Tax=Streptomyces chartreusis TaxID=1969 RepID=UPI00123CB508|nr:hypothetical protein [Streptomyces chartreusis]QEV66240.1 hypothetical protein CP983_05885 [Streptomyces chartreusis]GGW98872.1 hypothetical protein GCM10010321_11660 [Streptomyces chartreusis]
MSGELERLMAAQAKADEVVRQVAEAPQAGPLLRVAVTDVETGQRLGTGFVNYDRMMRRLRVVNDRSEHPLPK